MRILLRNNRGFTLIESMIAAAILSMSLLAVATIQSTYKKSETDIMTRISAHNLIGSFMTQLQNQNQAYPAVVASGGSAATYVLCFGKDSRPLANSLGEMGAQIVTTPLTHTEPTELCMNNISRAGGFEAHLIRDPTNPNLSTIYLIKFLPGTKEVQEKMIYKVPLFLPTAS